MYYEISEINQRRYVYFTSSPIIVFIVSHFKGFSPARLLQYHRQYSLPLTLFCPPRVPHVTVTSQTLQGETQYAPPPHLQVNLV